MVDTSKIDNVMLSIRQVRILLSTTNNKKLKLWN